MIGPYFYLHPDMLLHITPMGYLGSIQAGCHVVTNKTPISPT